MNAKSTLLKQYFLEIIDASAKKDFVSMNEIYNEIQNLVCNKITNKVFFSQMEKNKVLLPLRVVGYVKGVNSFDAVLYKESRCLEIYLDALLLEKWQKDFLIDNFSAIYKKVSVINKDSIYLDNEIRDFLNITNGDVIKFDLTNGLIISKFNIQNLWLSLNL